MLGRVDDIWGWDLEALSSVIKSPCDYAKHSVVILADHLEKRAVC
jgi:hypothetical protein